MYNPNAPCLKCGKPVGKGIAFCLMCVPEVQKRRWWEFWK